MLAACEESFETLGCGAAIGNLQSSHGIEMGQLFCRGLFFARRVPIGAARYHHAQLLGLRAVAILAQGTLSGSCDHASLLTGAVQCPPGCFFFWLALGENWRARDVTLKFAGVGLKTPSACLSQNGSFLALFRFAQSLQKCPIFIQNRMCI